MKLLFITILLMFTLIVSSQDFLSFSDFIAENGNGLEILSKIEDTKVKNKKVYTTHDCVSDACDKVSLVTVLLNEAVIKHVRKLPAKEGLIVLKSHQLWWKYFDSTPSLPNISGSGRGIYSLMTDFSRIKSRWEALKLPYKHYLVYAKIANLCQVRLSCGTHKMRFGEVCLKKEACWAHDKDAVETFGKYYHSFPISIVPESCQRSETIYAAVLQSIKGLYLCTWDQEGMPLAVHPLKNIKKTASVVLSADKAEVTGIDKENKKHKLLFDLNANNQTKIFYRKD